MAGASGSAMATVAEQNEHQDRNDHGNSPASENKEDEERDRSRSPRHKLNVPEPNPDNPLEVLSACASLAVGVTSMVAALKTSSEKLEVLIGKTQSLQNDSVRSMDTLAKAIRGMSQTVESLAGGVSYNTSRVGALCGEFQKVRKHLEWSMNRTFGDMMKEATAKGSEDTSRTTAIFEQLFEAMDRFQENIKEVARRMETMGIPAPMQEKGM
jgi:methyl-accepting chemotaxis protein